MKKLLFLIVLIVVNIIEVYADGCNTGGFAIKVNCNLSVCVNPGSSSDEPPNTNYTWDFGDGTPLVFYSGVKDTVCHTYAIAGNYTISLTVDVFTQGKICNMSTPVAVGLDNILNITNPQSVCTPNTVDITAPGVTAGSTAGATLTYWDDAACTIPSALPAAIAATGTYYIKQSTPVDCDIIKPVTVTINPAPVLVITDPAPVCEPAVVNITDPAVTAGSSGGTFTYWTDASATVPLANATAISISGTYYIKSITSLGCSVINPVVVVVNPLPVASFTADVVCFNTATTFTNTSTVANGTITSAWLFGGTGINPTPSSTATDPTYTYNTCNNAGNNATLIVTSDKGCVAVVTNPIVVHCLPVPNFTFNNGCEDDDNIQFTNTSTNGAGTVGILISKWRLGLSPLPITSNDINYTYTTAGSYNVNLNVTDVNGCTNSISETVSIYPKPAVDFTVTDVCLNAPNIFINATTLSVPAGFTDVINGYQWNYDFNGVNYTTDATSQNTQHVYGLAATQTQPLAMLIVKTNNNCADTIIKPVIVWTLPVAQYSVSAPCFPNPLLFINASSINAGINNNTMATMNMNWGNGQGQGLTNLNQTINYNYAISGGYTSFLIAESNHGCKDTLTVPIVIHAKPAANFVALPQEGCEPLCVTFVNTSTQNAAPVTETIIAYNWNYGDYNALSSNTASTPNNKHCYTNPSDTTQRHSPELIITTSAGCKDTLKQTNSIEVYPLPKANFMLSDDVVTMLNPQVYITDQSHLGTTITWDYGNTETQTIINANVPNSTAPYLYFYKDSGTYIIHQLVVTDKGCRDSTLKIIKVQPNYTFYVPNSFTPNGDGINDYFNVRGINIKDLDMMIFNRWGELIARIQGVTSKGWDGTDIRFNLMSQQEVYVWKLEYTDVFDIKHRGLVGTVTLVK